MMQFVRMTVGAILATTLMVTLTGAAQAQDIEERRPYRVKVGAFLPYDTNTKDTLGTNFLSVGVGYDLKRTQTFLPTVIEAYADYYKRIKTTIDFGRVDTLLFGGGLAARFLIADGTDGYTPYFGAGAGVYVGNANRTFGGASDSAQRITLGGKFLIGAELRQGFFGELEYNFLPHPSVLGSDIALSGFQFRAGYRF